MNEQTRVSKTVADIWLEVQREQKRFSQIIRILVALVVVAGGVAVAFTLVSYSDVRSFQGRFEQEIREARANTRVVVAEWKYESLKQAERLDSIEEEQTQQREQPELMQAMARALATSGVQQAPLSLAALSARAIKDAKNYGLGANLSTDTLVSGVLNAKGLSLSTDDRLLLEAVLAEYRTPDAALPQIRALIEQGQEASAKGFGYAIMARHFYGLTGEVNRAADPNCAEVIKDVGLAQEKDVNGVGPYLWAGECWRKRGDGQKAFDSFAKALALQGFAAATPDNIRVVANGLGTTLIARYASGQVTDEEGAKLIASLRPSLRNLDASDPEATKLGSPLDAARLLLNYAAKIRSEHGGGDVGRAYSSENIGFTYVLANNWKECLEHARQIDAIVASPWNLIILNICATEKAKAASGADKAQLLEEAELARVTLGQFSYDWFDEAELRKLLPPDRGATVDQLIKTAKSRRTDDAGSATAAVSTSAP